MKNSATIESLKGMRFGAMATELERQLQDPATYAHMGFEERVALLVDAEWNSRQNNKLIRCIREARFAEPGAAVEDMMDVIRLSGFIPAVPLQKRLATLEHLYNQPDNPFSVHELCDALGVARGTFYSVL